MRSWSCSQGHAMDVYVKGLLEIHTSCRNKLQVMRHGRVVDEGVCDHLVCYFLIANKYL